MKKTIVLSFAFITVFAIPFSSLRAEDATTTPSSQAALPSSYEQVPVTPADAQLIDEALLLIDSGDISEAEKRLDEALLMAEGLSSYEKTKETIGKINLDILFSKHPTSNSELYEVKPGDALEKIARKYKTTVDLIMKSNGLQSTLIRVGQKLKVNKATFTISVDKSDRTLTVFSDGRFLKQYPVAVGKSESETPVGSFSIDNKLENPTWFHAGAIVPPDSPENILGTRWLGFSIPSYGIHGTTLPETIGSASTSGCVRMYNHDVEELYSIIPTGVWVTVVE